MTDPSGEFGLVGGLFGIAAGALVETTLQLVENGGDFSNLDPAAIARSAAIGGVIGATGGVAGAAVRGVTTAARGTVQAGRILNSTGGRVARGIAEGAAGGAAGEAHAQILDSTTIDENGNIQLGSVSDGGAVLRAGAVGGLAGAGGGLVGGRTNAALDDAGLGRVSDDMLSGGSSGMTGGLGNGQTAGSVSNRVQSIVQGGGRSALDRVLPENEDN